MKRLMCVKTVVASLLLANAAVVWAASPKPLPYGASLPASWLGPIAVATTVGEPRGAYVFAASADPNQNLEVMAWHDTTSALMPVVATPVVEDVSGLTGVAA